MKKLLLLVSNFVNGRWILLTILVIAAVLRFWNLGDIPPHLTPDEASLGYNAYSILKTGWDEYGTLFPVIFKSFGDYKPGLYIYATVPFVAIFGLNEWSVRLPSVVAGVLTVFLIYLISKELFKKEFSILNSQFSILAALLAAINPWLIYFSRGAWEVNLSLTLTLAGIYFFLISLKNSRFLIVSSLFFSLTLLAYQGAKLSTGIVLVLLGLVYWKEFLSLKRPGLLRLVLAITIGLVISSPIVLSLFQGKAGRLEVFSVFSYPRPADYLQGQLAQGSETIGSLSYYLFHSESLNFARGILGRWFNHFSGRFLFFEGDWSNPRHTAPNSGVLILADIILLLAGFIAVVKSGLKKETLFVFLWLILAPLPAVLSRDQVHAVRAFNMAIPLILIMGVGLTTICNRVLKAIEIGADTNPPGKWNSFAPMGILGLIGVIYLANYLYFLDAYFVHLPKHASQLWEYGYKQIVETVTPIQQNYKTIKVQQSYAQPYIYFLFYQKYDPARYQKQAKLTESKYGDVGQVERLDNIYFAPIDWSVNRGDHGSLFVADTIRIPPDDSKDQSQFKLINGIKYLNGRDTAFRIIEVR